MRKLISLSIVLLIAVFAGCGEKIPCEQIEGTVAHTFKGKHKLMKMMQITNKEESMSGGFFLFMGSIGSSTKTINDVWFSWQLNTGEYAVSKISLQDMRFKIDNSIETPYIEFEISDYYKNYSGDNINWAIKYCVKYVIVTCKEADYPKQIKMPLNIDKEEK